jgi:hypothetical protein
VSFWSNIRPTVTRLLVILEVGVLCQCEAKKLVYNLVLLVVRPLAQQVDLSGNRFIDYRLKFHSGDPVDSFFDLEPDH